MRSSVTVESVITGLADSEPEFVRCLLGRVALDALDLCEHHQFAERVFRIPEDMLRAHSERLELAFSKKAPLFAIAALLLLLEERDQSGGFKELLEGLS